MQEEEINLLDYIKVIYKHRLSIIGLTIITVLITTVISFMMPKVYEASTTLTIINPISIEGSFSKADYSMETYVNLIKNRSLLAKIIAKYKLDLPPLKWNVFDFEKNIEIKEVPKAQLIKIKFKFNNAEEAVLIVKDIAEAAVALNQDIIKEETKKSNEFCTNQLQIASKKLGEDEKNLLEFNRSSNLASLDKEMSLLIATKGSLKTKYDSICLDIKEKEARLVEAKAQIKNQAKLEHIKKTITEDPALMQSLQSSKDIDIKALLSLQLNNEVVNPIYLDLAQGIVNISIDLKGLYSSKENIEKELRINEENIAKVQKAIVQLNNQKHELERRYKLSEESYLDISRIYNQNEFRMVSMMGNLRIIDYPATPVKPISSKKKLNIAVAFFLSLFLGVFLAFVREYFSSISLKELR